LGGLRKKGLAVTGHADVVVVGGGHNGLVAAAYLARAGLETVVCERREVPGGAAVSEHPFGPDYTVTSLSYVVSLLPPDLVRDLRLDQHGYHVYPQGPYFAPRRDGRYLRLPDDPALRHAEIAKFSAPDADAYGLYSSGGCWGRCCTRSRRVSDLAGLRTWCGRRGC
jgi:phytoene dehydrogenase-like protein